MRRADIKALPEQAELLRLFDYDAETGELTWRAKPAPTANRIKIGAPAGTPTKSGYVHVGIRKDGKFTVYLAHRIIWKMITGSDPKDQIDHVDGDRHNNRWSNLRGASNRQNKYNCGLYKSNKTGAKGIYLRHGKYRATLKGYGQIHYLGTFDTLQDAITVRERAAAALQGDFYRTA